MIRRSEDRSSGEDVRDGRAPRAGFSPLLGLTLALLLASGCGVGGGSSDSGGGGTTTTTAVGGRAVAGPFQSGLIEAFKVLASGQKDTSATGKLGSATTDARGNYTINVTDKTYSGPVLLEATGSFVDEAKTATEDDGLSTTGSKPLLGIIPNFVAGTNISNVQITPISHLTVALAQRLGSQGSTITSTAIQGFYTQVAAALGLTGLTGQQVFNLDPVDTSIGGRTGATDPELQLGFLLAGLATISKNNNVSQIDLLTVMFEDLNSDGLLDGLASGAGLTIATIAGGSISYNLDLLTTDLSAAISAFVQSALNKSGITDPNAAVITSLTGTITTSSVVVAVIIPSTTTPAVGSQVQLDAGSSSTSRAGVTLTYSWSVTRDGVNVVVTNATSAQATFSVDVAGTYVITLAVSDGTKISTTTVTIVVQGQQQTTTTLAIDSFSISPTTVDQGSSFTATMVVRNSGTLAATNATPSLSFSRSGVPASGDFGTPVFNPATETIAAGLTATFSGTVAVTSNATTGTVDVAPFAIASNASQTTTTAVSIVINEVLPTTTTLSVDSFLLSTGSAFQGTTLSATLVVRNLGAIPATSVVPTLSFERSGADASADFTVSATTPGSANVAVSGSQSYTFLIEIAGGATTGDVTVGARASGANFTAVDAVDATLNVAAPPVTTLSVGGISLTPSTTGAGGDFQASITVTNAGNFLAINVVPRLALTRGGNDASADFTVSATSPASFDIAAQGQQAFTFDVTVGSSAASGSVEVSAVATANNAASATAATSATLTISTKAALTLTALSASRTSLTTSQAFTVTATVTNTGQNTARITSRSLVEDGFTASPATGSTDVAAGQTSSFSFSATAGASAGAFSITSITLVATDLLSGSSIGLAANTATSVALEILAKPTLTIGDATLSSSSVTTGSTFSVTIPIANAGPGSVEVGGTALTYGSGLTATAQSGNPASVTAGTTGSFAFEVAVDAGATTGDRSATFTATATADTAFSFGIARSNFATVTVTSVPLVLPTSFPGATSSNDIAISPLGTTLWVANPENDTVTKFTISGSSLSKQGEVAVGDEPTFLHFSPDGQKLYVTNRVGGTVSVIDTGNGSVVDTITVGAEPCGIALTPNGTKAYVANSMSASISVLDLTTNGVAKTIALPGDEFFPFAVAVTNDNDDQDDDEKVFVTQFYAQLPDGASTDDQGDADDGRVGKVSVIDSSSDSITSTITLNPHDTGFAPEGASGTTTAFPNFLSSVVLKGDKGYVTNTAMSPRPPVSFVTNTQSFLSVFSTTAMTEVTTHTFNMNDVIESTSPKKFFLNTPWSLAFAQNTTAAYVLSAASNVAMRLRLESDGKPAIDGFDELPTTTSVIQVQVGKNPRGIAINADGSLAYVHNHIGRDVNVIDTATNAVVSTAEAAALPTAGTDAAKAHRGQELFNTSRGESSLTSATPNRMSTNGWGSCFSCHAFGWTDTVVWSFAAGPRRATPLNGSFTKMTPEGTDPVHQRIFNWTAVFDEVADFELNIRGVSSKAKTVEATSSNPPTGLIIGVPSSQITALGVANTPRSTDWQDITDYFKFGIRNPVSPRRTEDVSAGRAIFAANRCDTCHGGSNWTSSRIFYTTPPPPNGNVNEVLRGVGTFISTEVKANGTPAAGAAGFNPPSLMGAWAFPPFLHNGQAKTMEEVLTLHLGFGTDGTDSIAAVLSATEEQQLIAFLESIDDQTTTFPNIAQIVFDNFTASSTITRGTTDTVTITVSNSSDARTATVTSVSLVFGGTVPITAVASSPPTSIPTGDSVQLTFEVSAPANATLGTTSAVLSLGFEDGLTTRTLSRIVGSIEVVAPPVSVTLSDVILPSASFSRGQTFPCTLPVTNAAGAADVTIVTSSIFELKSNAITFDPVPGNATTLSGNGVTVNLQFIGSVPTASSLGSHTIRSFLAFRDVNDPPETTPDESEDTNAATFTIQTPPDLSLSVPTLDGSTSAAGGASVQRSPSQTVRSLFVWSLSNPQDAATAIVTDITAVFTNPTGVTVTLVSTGATDLQTDSEIAATETGLIRFSLGANDLAVATPNDVTVTAFFRDKNRLETDSAGQFQETTVIDFDVVDGPQLSASTVFPAIVDQGETKIPLEFTVSNSGSSASAAVTTLTPKFRTQGGSNIDLEFTVRLVATDLPATLSAGESATVTFEVDVSSSAATQTDTVSATVTASNSKTGESTATSVAVDTFTVQSKRPKLVIVSLTPSGSEVATGQTTSFEMVIDNRGAVAADVTTPATLTFTSSGEVTPVTVTQSTVVTQYAANSTRTVTLTAEFGSGATPLGNMSIDADVPATSSSGGSDVTTSDSDLATLRLVQELVAENTTESSAAPSGIDRGSTAPVEVTVELGVPSTSSSYRVTSTTLTLSIGSSDVTSQYSVTYTGPTLPGVISSGESEVLTFEVTAGAAATKATTVLLVTTAFGTDVNTGSGVALESTTSWVVRDAATVFLGQASSAGGSAATTQGGLKQPTDFLVSGGKMIVVDQGNHRVLLYDSVGQVNPTTVLGQTGFTGGFANQNSGGPLNNSLSSPAFAAVTGSRLIVSDQGNHRVVIFDNWTTKSNGAGFDVLVGQNFTNQGSANRSQSTSAGGLSFPDGLAVSGDRLVVADTGNHRVLVFDGISSVSSSTAVTFVASFAYGQPDLTSSSSGATTTSFNSPLGVDVAGDRVAVADSLNNRVLVFTNFSATSTSGTSATVVLGQPDFTTSAPGTVSSTSMNAPQDVTINRDKLYVSDHNNNRVLVFENFASLSASNNGTAAVDLVGQALFSDDSANNTVILPGAPAPSVDAFGDSSPLGVFSGTTGSDTVWFADLLNNRVLLVPLP